MGLATLLPGQFDLLHGQASLQFQIGPIHYDIRRQGELYIYSVSDGKETLSEPIPYAFGYGMKGQTYVLLHHGAYYESHVSYYPNLKGLDVTFGRSFEIPDTLDKAFGEKLSSADAQLCFSCHNTAAVTQGKLNTSGFMPGVGCEACHGPGAEHVAAMKSGKFDSARVFNPGQLEPGDQVDFCGTCHRTWEQVVKMQISGVRNVRFQPYRLSNSKCWSYDDARISCIACHDPHLTIRPEPASYDSKCLACHVSGRGARPNETHPGRACPVARENYVTCHMPKYTLPEGKSEFTDHFIRTVRTNAPYPD
jgi:cytochrome c554/c'-like protein